MKVCITEKPSVARDIASILGADIRRDGYFEGNGYAVTWTYGHLCCLKEPADYSDTWKRWSLGALPMIPARFGIKLIEDKGIEKQFKVIETLVGHAEEVVNCGDAGQEGELIQRWVMQKASVKCPVKRLWISSLTDASIKEGFKNLVPASKYDNLYYAGLSRAIGDWLLGMNATRLYSLRYSSPGKVLSIGRVQTPTLALIVKRQEEIDNFKPEDFWELKTLYRDIVFSGTSGRYNDIEKAERAVEEAAKYEFTVDKVEEKKGKEYPPKLFDLTTLQVECNKKYGWTAEETLRLIQSLYERKLTTYPRVDTTYLSSDIYQKIPDIMRRMTPYANLTSQVLSKNIVKTKRIFDDAKVTDHHAIIPTGESPSILSDTKERQLYHFIALRFIAAFWPECNFMTTTVTGHAGEYGFKAQGKVIVNPGWRIVFDNKNSVEPQPEDTSEDKILPPFTEGEIGPHEPSVQKKTTQPPKLYNEGTLLRAMETAGRTVDDEELREAMKENGIGRPSTRAAIIETLFKRGFLRRERKNILPTQAGIELISTIGQELLKSAKLTGIWENKLRRIERGEFQASEFLEELKMQVREIVHDVLNDSSHHRIEVLQGGEVNSSGKETDKKPKGKKKEVKEK